MKNFNIPTILAITTIALAGLTNVQACESPMKGPLPFSSYDQDANGAITEAEFDAVRAKRHAKRTAEGKQARGEQNASLFSKFDSNNDAQLSQEELLAGQKMRMEMRREKMQAKRAQMQANMPKFADIDLDNNGMIAASELNQFRAKRMAEKAQAGHKMKNAKQMPTFTELDTNGDGSFSKEEFAAHRAEHRQQFAQNMREKSMQKQQAKQRKMPGYADFDTNGDGKLLEEEFMQARSKRMAERAQEGRKMKNAANMPSFADIDSNSDGDISPDELAAHQAQHRQHKTH